MDYALLIFPILWLAVLILAYFLLPRKHELNFRLLALYISFMAMLGPVGEVFVGTFYEAAFGSPLWQYEIFPIHTAYTSLYAPVIWGVAGAYVYYTHEILRVWSQRPKLHKATLHMFETITVEALLNISFLALTGGLIFYYTPGDLWHITSLQTLPFYFVLGLIVIVSMKRMREHALFNAIMSLGLMFVFVYLTN